MKKPKPVFKHVDMHNECTTRAFYAAMRRGCWVEFSTSLGYLLVDPSAGFVWLRSDFAICTIKELRQEWWYEGWGKKVKKTCKSRYVLSKSKVK